MTQPEQQFVARVLCPMCNAFVPLAGTPIRTFRTLGGEEQSRYVCAHHGIRGLTYEQEQSRG